jgi:phenol 2-monooxygenase (NADPH)
MVIPRERIATGQYLTRLYVQVHGEVNPEVDQIPVNGGVSKERYDARARKQQITLEGILEQAQKVFKPYYVRLKDNAAPDWWAAYQIGQRVTEQFAKKDSKGINRVFIVGDGNILPYMLFHCLQSLACHTHSPKAGQGMNVSMMDSYNLSWKLVHSIHGLTPAPNTKPDPLLETYQIERHTIAQQLIEFDKQFSSMFSGQMGSDGASGSQGLTHDEFLEVFSTGNGFTSGCGIEYPDNMLVDKSVPDDENPIEGTDYLSGILRPGRRLLNVKVKRHADGCQRDLQDGMHPLCFYFLCP